MRVPVLRAHAESINLPLKQPLSPERARTLLAEAASVEIVDEREHNRFPMPTIARGAMRSTLAESVGTCRSPGFGLDLFVCGDQLRKGAALNAVQIAEVLVAALN